MTSPPRRLNLIGSHRGSSGYDRHTRELARALVQRGVAVQFTPVAGWSPAVDPAGWEELLDGLAEDVGATTAIHFAMPPDTRPLAGTSNVNYTMFEADRIPRAWAERAEDHDLTIVPTAAARAAWVRCGVAPQRVAVSPLGVDAGFFAAPVPPLMVGARRRTRFLNVAELRPRKNHAGLLRAWVRATRADDDAALVLKLSAYQDGALAQFAADVRALGGALETAAPLEVVAATMGDAEMRALHRGATHYLSLSHGEGWDQAAMEAAASGAQLIVPRHTAYAENYRDDEVSFVPVAAEPAVVEGEDAELFAGTTWWTPDEDAAVAAIRDAIDGEPRASALPERLAREFTWEAAAERLLAVLP